MSLVTSVVIISAYYSLEENLKILNKYLVEEKYTDQNDLLSDVCKKTGYAGTKAMQRYVMLGAFNYLDKDEFIKLFKSLNWEGAILILGDDDSDEGYQIVSVDTKINIV